MAWKRVQSLTEHLALLRQGDLLFHGGRPCVTHAILNSPGDLGNMFYERGAQR
jgi:hypothetical protein